MCKVLGSILNTAKGKRKSSGEVKQGLPAAVSALSPHKDDRAATF